MLYDQPCTKLLLFVYFIHAGGGGGGGGLRADSEGYYVRTVSDLFAPIAPGVLAPITV